MVLAVLVGCGTSEEAHSNTAPVIEARVSPAALRVARSFLETAVGRKDLASAYTLVGPWLKGVSKAQWIKGNNPVTYFPASNLKTAPFKVKSSTKNALLLEVGPLLAGKGTKIGGLPSLAFTMEVDRIHGKWLVNYFMPDYSLKRLAADKAGQGSN